jgi:hypothetical protein
MGNVLTTIKANTENILIRLTVTAVNVIAAYALFRRTRVRVTDVPCRGVFPT